MPGVRFAPSPTGLFHVGNLRTAWISHQWSKVLNAPWVIRFEDIDQPRVVEGAQKQQLADLKVLGLIPDSVIVQSTRHQRHWQLFEKALAEGTIYRCTCSRQDIQQEIEGMASAPHTPPPLYTGKCRHSQRDTQNPTVAWRFKNGEDPSGGQDFIVARTPAQELSETNFSPAYHWACAIDDHDGDYQLLVRAWDLEPALHIQRKIHLWLSAFEKTKRTPAPVFHTALVVQNNGHRLEKRTAGVTLSELLNSGVSVEQLIKIFANSFEQPTELEPGESLRKITLQQLKL